MRDGSRETPQGEQGTYPETGLGVPCWEAQADGVPCDELGADCTDCERVDAPRAKPQGEKPATT